MIDPDYVNIYTGEKFNKNEHEIDYINTAQWMSKAQREVQEEYEKDHPEEFII